MLNYLNAQIVLSRRTVAQADAVRRQAAVRDHRAIFEAVKAGTKSALRRLPPST